MCVKNRVYRPHGTWIPAWKCPCSAQSMVTSLRTAKVVKHIAMLSFATLWMIWSSVFVASCVDCVEKPSQELLDILDPLCRLVHASPGQRWWTAQYDGNSQLQAHPNTRDFGLLWHSVHRYFNKSHSEAFQRSWEWAKGKTLFREWKNPIAYALSIDSWRWEGALSGIRRGCQSHVIHVGSFSLLQASGTFLPP